MSESSKLFPDGSFVRLLVGVEGREGVEVPAGATGVILSGSEGDMTYLVQTREGPTATVLVDAGNVVLD